MESLISYLESNIKQGWDSVLNPGLAKSFVDLVKTESEYNKSNKELLLNLEIQIKELENMLWVYRQKEQRLLEAALNG